MNVNPERLAQTFASLVKIDSVSKNEARFCQTLKQLLESMGAETMIDQAAIKVGGDCGNLIARIPGQSNRPPMLLCAHMDTVEPGKGIKPIFKDGVFTSDGTTILGSDDKSAIAIIIECLRVLKENQISHCPLDLVFTVCEEIGLMGARHLDHHLIRATFGYVLDAADTQGIVVRAPAANSFEFVVHGKDAHAGAAPEKGINAIWLASKAIAALQIGRIDWETTCNIGLIEGGLATNIVPNLVRVKGEVRSHDEGKLQQVMNQILSSFQSVVKNYPASTGDGLPKLETSVNHDFSRTMIPEDHLVVTLVQKAAQNLGRNMATKTTGGGADANIFFQKGIITGVLGTGMRDVHTVREFVKLEDMVHTAETLLEAIRLYSAGEGMSS